MDKIKIYLQSLMKFKNVLKVILHKNILILKWGKLSKNVRMYKIVAMNALAVRFKENKNQVKKWKSVSFLWTGEIWKNDAISIPKNISP